MQSLTTSRDWFAGTKTALAAILACACFLLAGTTHAQILRGAWVDASEKAIEQHRKTDVKVIVLDTDDRALQGATVRLIQQRHDFILGVSLPADRLPPKGLKDLPVYRCLNAIALDRLTDWSFPPADSELTPRRVASAWQNAVKPIEVAFGRVVSADPARNSDKTALLKPVDLRDAVLARIEQAVGFEPHADHFDLYADLIYQDLIERKLGEGMLHRMFEQARAKRPDATFALRVRDTISLQRGRDLARVVRRLEVRQVPFDRITIEQRFTGQAQPLALKRLLDEQVAPLPVPVILSEIEVGGKTDVAAALYMETLLRLAFAQPNIDGIYFAGLEQDGLIEDNAALITADGEPTAPGSALDQMFHAYWRSDESVTSDERGNADARVFTGWYTIEVTLPSGGVITTKAYVPKAERAKLIVLQQTKAEQ